MAVRTVGVIMNGVTGRMGTNQHLVHSLLAIRKQGGIPLPGGDVLMPDPLLLGRSEQKLRALAQDKLFLPGLLKLKRVVDSGFLGRILAVRGEFGYWVFEGDWQPAQRPSWNYKVAGLHECKVQSRVNTPKAVWNPTAPNPFEFRDDWLDVPAHRGRRRSDYFDG